MRETFKEAINRRFLQRRSKSIKHGSKLYLTDPSTFICVILSQHCSPELLSKCWIWHIFSFDEKLWTVLLFPFIRILQFQRNCESMKVGISITIEPIIIIQCIWRWYVIARLKTTRVAGW